MDAYLIETKRAYQLKDVLVLAHSIENAVEKYRNYIDELNKDIKKYTPSERSLDYDIINIRLITNHVIE